MFHHFYVTMVTNDWVPLFLRHGAIETCDGLPTFIKKWKPEYFSMDVSVFGGPMHFEDPPSGEHDQGPELINEERSVIDRLVEIFLSGLNMMIQHFLDWEVLLMSVVGPMIMYSVVVTSRNLSHRL